MSPTHLSRLEGAVRSVLAFHEAFNRQDVEAMLQLVSPDCVFENASPAPDGTRIAGRENLAQFWQAYFTGSPRARLHIEEIFGLGYRCIMRWRLERGEADGQQSHVRGVDIFLVQNGLIHEQYSYLKG